MVIKFKILALNKKLWMYSGYIVINQITSNKRTTYIVNYGDDNIPLIDSFTCDKVIDCFKIVKENHLIPKKFSVEKIEIENGSLNNVIEELSTAYKYFEE
jgi:hypothetical protein